MALRCNNYNNCPMQQVQCTFCKFRGIGHPQTSYFFQKICTRFTSTSRASNPSTISQYRTPKRSCDGVHNPVFATNFVLHQVTTTSSSERRTINIIAQSGQTSLTPLSRVRRNPLCRWGPRCQQLLSEFCPHFLRQSVVRGAQSFRHRIIFYHQTFASRKQRARNSQVACCVHSFECTQLRCCTLSNIGNKSQYRSTAVHWF